MTTLADTAPFRATDPDVLVSASLACPICLAVEGVDWGRPFQAEPTATRRQAGVDDLTQ